jgi:hypothetical protein
MNKGTATVTPVGRSGREVVPALAPAVRLAALDAVLAALPLLAPGTSPTCPGQLCADLFGTVFSAPTPRGLALALSTTSARAPAANPAVGIGTLIGDVAGGL